MSLGWKVDDEIRSSDPPVVVHQHLARYDFLGTTGVFIEFVVRRECLLELQCNSFAHKADAVDRVDQRLGIGLQNIALSQFNHDRFLFNNTNRRGC